MKARRDIIIELLFLYKSWIKNYGNEKANDNLISYCYLASKQYEINPYITVKDIEHYLVLI